MDTSSQLSSKFAWHFFLFFQIYWLLSFLGRWIPWTNKIWNIPASLLGDLNENQHFLQWRLEFATLTSFRFLFKLTHTKKMKCIKLVFMFMMKYKQKWCPLLHLATKDAAVDLNSLGHVLFFTLGRFLCHNATLGGQLDKDNFTSPPRRDFSAKSYVYCLAQHKLDIPNTNEDKRHCNSKNCFSKVWHFKIS